MKEELSGSHPQVSLGTKLMAEMSEGGGSICNAIVSRESSLWQTRERSRPKGSQLRRMKLTESALPNTSPGWMLSKTFVVTVGDLRPFSRMEVRPHLGCWIMSFNLPKPRGDLALLLT